MTREIKASPDFELYRTYPELETAADITGKLLEFIRSRKAEKSGIASTENNFLNRMILASPPLSESRQTEVLDYLETHYPGLIQDYDRIERIPDTYLQNLAKAEIQKLSHNKAAWADPSHQETPNGAAEELELVNQILEIGQELGFETEFEPNYASREYRAT